MKLSIVTITFNNRYISKTINSVINQCTNPTEHIIIDNLSTDNTSIIVKKYQQSAKYQVKYIREPDTGRYNAMNKGIMVATGEYLLFLNAGDTLHNHQVIEEVIPQLDKDIVYGDIHGKSLNDITIDKQFFIQQSLFHQATFIKRSLFDKLGLYDESLVIASDFDFFVKAILIHLVSIKYLPLIVCDYDSHGISSTGSDLVYKERALVLSRYLHGKQHFYHLVKYYYYQYKKYLPNFIIKWQRQRLASQPKI